jgi:hypothetical protein
VTWVLEVSPRVMEGTHGVGSGTGSSYGSVLVYKTADRTLAV